MPLVTLCYYQNDEQVENLLKHHPEFADHERVDHDQVSELVENMVGLSVKFQQLVGSTAIGDESLFEQQTRLYNYQAAFWHLANKERPTLYLAKVEYVKSEIPGVTSVTVPISHKGKDAYLPNCASELNIGTLINLHNDEIDVLDMRGPR